MDHDKRIQNVLGENRKRNKQNATRYLDYLRQTIEFPCRLTGTEDFPWEEPYVMGGWDEDEYEELKKENPSYTDVFELVELLEPDSNHYDIIAKIKRVTDLKNFEVGLSWIECLNSDDVNYQLIKDYAVWHINY
jgi:hypothetical protein